MDTRADPLCVCAHRSSFSDSRSRVNQFCPSTFEKTNKVVSSEKEADLSHNVPYGTDNVRDTVLHIDGSIVGGSISIISPNADRSLPAVIAPEAFILPKRSRSCNGRVETPATVTTSIQESGAPRTRGANISWANDLREWDVNGHSSGSNSHKTPGLAHSGPNNSKSMEEDDYKPSHKTQDVKIYLAHDQSTQTEPIEALLVVPRTIELTDQPCGSISSSPTLIETKSMQEEEEDLFWGSRSKRPKQGTEDVKLIIDVPHVVGDADGSSHHASSSFDSHKFLGLDYQFVDLQYDSPTGVNASKSKDRSDGQVDPRPKLQRFPASAPTSLGRSQDSSGAPINASPFISALDKFNEMVANCDAMERFQEPNLCLGTKKDGLRCRQPIAFKNRKDTEQLLTELTAMNIQTNARKFVIDGLRKLVDLAVCYYQCEELKKKVDQLVLADPPKDSARPSDGPIPGKDTPKFKFEQVPDPPRISDESRTSDGHDLHAVDTSWCRKSPKQALVYIPDYRPHYKSRRSYELNVEDWVMEQAATPLTESEVEEGYLYVYWNQAAFGVRKIGYTVKDVSGRLSKWESKCKHVAEEQYRSPSIVRNAKRLERLVHAELKAYRVKEHGCHGCSRSHEEWFCGVDFDIIRESIDFWTEWIMEGHYENINGKWSLKKDAKKKLQQVFQLCNRISVANARESEEKSITKSPPRYNLRRRSVTRSPSRGSRRY